MNSPREQEREEVLFAEERADGGGWDMAAGTGRQGDAASAAELQAEGQVSLEPRGCGP